jgi:8-oxo-dGTP pyrophosphatase MutT (NUDIX family)
LILKNRPAWQEGFWNGIGGKVEGSEEPYQAAIREFKEETGVEEFFWVHYATVYGKEPDREGTYEVYYYRALDTRALSNVRWLTDEVVAIHRVDSLPEKLVEHVNWMLPLALNRKGKFKIYEE